ncbi:glucose-1-phosphate adenylyltransferase [Paraferrimonas sp. SM1919]|uniref:glucose-1-phosphate adenylyltransferase n=1 Tax=Paraferrimonas sp. SM1919 TaxID=2662263 RepID=UPI0013D4EBBD|nr:glucose-1-phosphate adenylyltransferase [Paraferrimonas sp. SM1919]
MAIRQQISTGNLNAALAKTIAVVLAGGRGSRLKELTDNRSKPAVPIAGKYKIIDFPLSNCLNSGIRRIGVATQYRSHTLNQHIQRGWSFFRADLGESMELWPAQQQTDGNWYQGTADAVYQNLSIIGGTQPEYVVVLAGDHIYKQDYSLMLRDHIDSQADITVGCIEVSKQEASEFGVMAVDLKRNITSFVEKPSSPPTIPGSNDRCLASMGIYIFNADFLFQRLQKDAQDLESSHDFGNDIIPSAIGTQKIIAHPLSLSCIKNKDYETPYWRDVGTLTAYWQANIDLTKLKPQLDLYDDNWPIHTTQYQRPAAKFNHNSEGRVGYAVNSVVSAGCLVSGASVEQSMLFNHVTVNSYSHIQESVLLPNCEIGRGCQLKKVILDMDCKLPADSIIGFDEEFDNKYFRRNEDGIVLVTQAMIDAWQQEVADQQDSQKQSA